MWVVASIPSIIIAMPATSEKARHDLKPTGDAGAPCQPEAPPDITPNNTPTTPPEYRRDAAGLTSWKPLDNHANEEPANLLRIGTLDRVPIHRERQVAGRR